MPIAPRAYLLCLAHSAKWATALGLTSETLSSALIARFVDEHLPCCDCPRPVQRHRVQVRAALRQLQPALMAANVAFIEATLTADEVEYVLASFDPSVAAWRRGLAIAQCVARLGLRSAEVVALEFDDLDWDSGTIRLRRSKARRVDRLPMPVPVGEAIAAYLRHERPSCKTRRVFVRHVAPVEAPLLPGVVKRALGGAYARCGLPYTRVHIFRHSLAARMLAGGGTLKEVADVLRHRHLDTTQIYAKVDLRRLEAVAMPWPGSNT